MDNKEIVDSKVCNKKKNKFDKFIIQLYDKLTSLLNQNEFLFKNKFIDKDLYIEKMNLFSDLNNKINNLELEINKKKFVKNFIENKINEINNLYEKISNKIGSNSIKKILDIYLNLDIFLEDKNNNYKKLLDIYDEYFIPLISNKVTDIDSFIKKYNIKDINVPVIIKSVGLNNTLIEKISGATIVFYVNSSKIIIINGYFKKDSLNICRNLLELNNKLLLMENENLDIPAEFKEYYIEQLSLRDFIILSSKEINELIKNDYTDFLNYKNKSLSSLIKEFMKSSVDKQRRILILFLIADQESQFTAHIIFDLITDKSFVSGSQYIADILFDSLHWKIQKIFKTSQSNFEMNKKKMENISINDVPYESRILTLKITDVVKSKAMDKLKEINGSKENSIKAQQWLDGFLKIPFNIFKKESIINFFKIFQLKIENYIEIFTLKISEYDFNKLNTLNKSIYDIIIQIIDEYHAAVYKSENSYSLFIKYIEKIKIDIIDLLGHDFSDIKVEKLDSNKEENNNIVPDEDVINKCMTDLTFCKKIKNELYKNNFINNNNISTIVKKLNEIESTLNVTLIKDEEESPLINILEDKYNIGFRKYIIENINDFDNFIKEWNLFKDKKTEYMLKVDKILDKCTYGQTDAKLQMKRVIGQWMNGVSKGQCFGLCGPPGVGKTTLCKNGFAKCLFDENGESRPFAFLPLGGATNGSILEGHHYTYMGSTWGKIIDILIETKCMNPIIYIDELDKISKTEHGKEIISILTHITDQSQNKEYYDRYFASIPIDLSEILFIFSYNDRDSIDRILRDRIQEINIKPLSLKEKLIISHNYTNPDILSNIGFGNSEVVFTNEILIKIINEYTYEAGVRKLNEILYDIVREINLKKIEGDKIEYPIYITEKYIEDILSGIPKITSKMIGTIPKVGLVNGLYATTMGLGGLTIIQVMKTISDKKLSLEKLTGSQGDVMKESMNCALTLAWNIIPDNLKKELNESKDGYGLHIHCPESATPKDGPSAGLAITTAIISRITNIPIRNDLAMTGEVDLLGKAHEIGGLYSKLQGALSAGVKKVLIPKDNEKDLNIIFKKEQEEYKKSTSHKKIEILVEDTYPNKRIFRDELEIYLVNNIFEVLEHALTDNNILFNTTF